MPLHKTRVGVPNRGIAAVGGSAVDRARAQDQLLIMRGRIQILKGSRLRRETGRHAVPRQPGAGDTLFEHRSEQCVRHLTGCRGEHGCEALGAPVVEKGLVTRCIDAMHRDPSRPLALHPDGGIPGIRGIPVYAERDHPVSLRGQMIKVALMLGAGYAMICFEHATSLRARLILRRDRVVSRGVALVVGGTRRLLEVF